MPSNSAMKSSTLRREEIYSEWEKITCEDGTAFFGKESRKKFDKISDVHFSLYERYQSHLFAIETNRKSAVNRRSRILDFLLWLESINCSLSNITQDALDTYFAGKKKDKATTITSRVNYLKDFFIYHAEIFSETIDVDRYRKSAENIAKMQQLTPYQISHCRQRYKDDWRKLYIFEMIYYTDFTDEEIKNVKIEDVNHMDCSIQNKDASKKIHVPSHLIELIDKMNERGIFGCSFDIVAYIGQMREELKSLNIQNFNVKDGIATRRKTFCECPQCGNKYEMIADNWCVIQYTENGAFWIVCREKCGRESQCND